MIVVSYLNPVTAQWTEAIFTEIEHDAFLNRWGYANLDDWYQVRTFHVHADHCPVCGHGMVSLHKVYAPCQHIENQRSRPDGSWECDDCGVPVPTPRWYTDLQAALAPVGPW